jgi:hypothetical protein
MFEIANWVDYGVNVTEGSYLTSSNSYKLPVAGLKNFHIDMRSLAL